MLQPFHVWATESQTSGRDAQPALRHSYQGTSCLQTSLSSWQSGLNGSIRNRLTSSPLGTVLLGSFGYVTSGHCFARYYDTSSFPGVSARVSSRHLHFRALSARVSSTSGSGHCRLGSALHFRFRAYCSGYYGHFRLGTLVQGSDTLLATPPHRTSSGIIFVHHRRFTNY